VDGHSRARVGEAGDELHSENDRRRNERDEEREDDNVQGRRPVSNEEGGVLPQEIEQRLREREARQHHEVRAVEKR
jgi:hypothetical protein